MSSLLKGFIQRTAPRLASFTFYSQYSKSGYTHFRRKRSGFLSKQQVGIVGGVCGFGFLYWVSCLETVPYTNRRHAIMISTFTERRLGRSLFEEVKRNAIKSGTLLPNYHPSVNLVRSVGERIAEVASSSGGEGHIDHMKNMDWEFIVVESNDVNAFVVPGGKVVVFTGLIRIMQTADELAGVLAHEVAHVVARHTAERITEVGILMVGRMAFSLIFGFHIPLGLTAILFSLPHSRRAETEADTIGVRLMAKACFEPKAAASMLKKLDRMEKMQKGKTVDALLRTHPVTSERVSKVERDLETAQVIFQDNDCYTKRRHLRTLR